MEPRAAGQQSRVESRQLLREPRRSRKAVDRRPGPRKRRAGARGPDPRGRRHAAARPRLLEEEEPRIPLPASRGRSGASGLFPSRTWGSATPPEVRARSRPRGVPRSSQAMRPGSPCAGPARRTRAQPRTRASGVLRRPPGKALRPAQGKALRPAQGKPHHGRQPCRVLPSPEPPTQSSGRSVSRSSPGTCFRPPLGVPTGTGR